jgi:hypothetical protein
MTVYRYCTPEWLAESAVRYRQDPSFQERLEKLSLTVCFNVKAEPAWGIEEDIIFGTQVERGELKNLSFYSKERARQEADFILAAKPQEWKRILRKESKFVGDFMTGKITLEQGSKVGVLGLAPHSGAMVDALTQLELQFPDEMSPQELEAYRRDMQTFRKELGV